MGTATRNHAPAHARVAPPSRDRYGYYRLGDGLKLLSVTTIIAKGVPKPALVPWAARQVAEAAMESLPKLLRARGAKARTEAITWLSNAAEQKRDNAADLGSAIHKQVEAIVLGTSAPTPTPEEAPFVAAFRRFLDEWQPRFEASEMVVAHPEHGWAGTLDWIATLPRLGEALVLGDNKTGKGVYAEAALQLAAYRRATTAFVRDGVEVAMPDTGGAVVLHLRPDGYRLIPVQTGDDVYTAFLHAAATARWAAGDAKTVLGEPLHT